MSLTVLSNSFPVKTFCSKYACALNKHMNCVSFAILKAVANENNVTTRSKPLRLCYTSLTLTLVFNPCYTRQRLTQLCCSNGQRRYTVCYTRRFLTQLAKFFCRFLNRVQKLATCCPNEMLR